jgi:hypothetical protein
VYFKLEECRRGASIPALSRNFPECPQSLATFLLRCIVTSNLKSVVAVQKEIVELGRVAGLAGGVEFGFSSVVVMNL